MDLQSLLGYSKGSPYVNNPYLDIQGNTITMENTEIPLWLQPMKNGKKIGRKVKANPYAKELFEFPGADSVRETPLQQGGFNTPSGPYIKNLTTKENQTNKYTPSEGTEWLKAILAGASYSPNPLVNLTGRIGSATGDAYTGMRHLASGDYKEGMEDLAQIPLDFVGNPFKANSFINLTKNPSGLQTLISNYKVNPLSSGYNHLLSLGRHAANANDIVTPVTKPSKKNGGYFKNPYQKGGMTTEDLLSFLFEGDDVQENSSTVMPPSTEELEEMNIREQQLDERERIVKDMEQYNTSMDIATRDFARRERGTIDGKAFLGNPYSSDANVKMVGNPYNTSETASPNKVNDGTPFTGNASIDNKSQYAFDFFKSKGLTKEQSAAIVANLKQESGNFSDDVIDFRRRGDSGTAYGIAQWRGDRKENLFKFAQSKGLSPASLDAQLMFVEHEAKQRGDWERVKRTTNLNDATHAFNYHYEVSQDSRNPSLKYMRTKHVLDKQGNLIFK